MNGVLKVLQRCVVHIECVSDEVENMSRGKKASRRRNKEHQGRKRKESGAWSLELGRPTASNSSACGFPGKDLDKSFRN